MSKNIDIIEELKVIEHKVYEVLGSQKENIEVITNYDDLDSYISKVLSIGIVSVDTETNNSLDPTTCKLMGLCLYAPSLKQVYISINHRNPITKIRLSNQLTEDEIKVQLLRIIESKIPVIMHNGKFDYEVLKCTTGVKVVPYWDTIIAAKLLNENEPASLKTQYISKIDPTQEKYSIDKLFTKVQYADVDPFVFALYAATDALMTYKLYEYQKDQMELKENEKIKKLFFEIEMPMIEIVGDMELYGVRADLDYCKKLKLKYENKIVKIDKDIFEKIKKLSDVLEHWKNSKEAVERERIFVSKKEQSKLDLVELERKYPYLDDKNGLRYKIGKRKIDILTDPINLNSPKQLSLLFYEIFGATKVLSKNPYGTGKTELELLKDKFTQSKEELKLLMNKVFNSEEIDVEEDLDEEEKLDIEKGKLIKVDSLVFDNTNEEYEKGINRLKYIIKICELLLQRRGYEKLLSTYINVVPSLVQHWSDHKVRFHLNSLGAHTGRFTSGGKWKFYEGEEPIILNGMNSQNIPSNTSKEIRLIFLADEGRTFVGGDWSQQEPKITAFLSQEPKMIQAYDEGKDIYATIAQMIYKNNYEDNLEFYDKEKTQLNLKGKQRRSVGKTVILATMYGMGVRTIASKLGIEVDEAAEILYNFYNEFTKLSKCQDDTILFCKRYGYVEDVMGRKRRLPNIQLPMYKVRFSHKPKLSLSEANSLLERFFNRLNDKQLAKKELAIIKKEAKENNIIIESNEEHIKKAERQTFNARIQGSAATMAKKTMILIYNDPVLKKCDVNLVFQIHDELIVDCPIEHVEVVKNRLKRIMENSAMTLGITIPMKCDIEVERRWGEATMSTEIKESYLTLVEKGVKNPLEELSKQYPNFPIESLRKVIEGESDRIIF